MGHPHQSLIGAKRLRQPPANSAEKFGQALDANCRSLILDKAVYDKVCLRLFSQITRIIDVNEDVSVNENIAQDALRIAPRVSISGRSGGRASSLVPL